MPEITFDEFGLPVWTNSTTPDGSGTDPDPLGAAIAAVNQIGTPDRPFMPQQPTPGTTPIGPPPDDSNYLMAPNGELQHPPGPEQLAPPQPQPQTTGTQFNPADVVSGPSDTYAEAQGGPVTSPQAIPQPIPAGKPGKVDAVDAATLAAGQAQYDQAAAANEAARASAERRAAVGQEFAQRQAQSDASFQQARNQAQADSDRETAQWMTQMENLARQEPNPKRWFANQSTFGKVMWLASLAFGTKAAATAPGVQNIGLMMIREEMDKDMAEQRAKLAREIKIAEMRGQQIDKKTAQRLAMLKDDHSIRAGQLLALEKSMMERANAPGSEDDRAAMAAAHTWVAQQRLQTAATKAQQAYQSREAAIARAHAAEQNRLSREQADRHFELTRVDRAAELAMELKAKYDLAQVSASDKAAEAAAKKAAETQAIDPDSSGVVVVDKKTGQRAGDGVLRIPNDPKGEKKEKFENQVVAANTAHSALRTIRDSLKDKSFTEKLVGGDPVLNQALTELGYATARANDPRGIVTDSDFSNGLLTSLGVKWNSAAGRISFDAQSLMSGKDADEEMLRGIEHQLGQIQKKTEQRLNVYVNADDIKGSKITFTPRDWNTAAASGPESKTQADVRITGEAQTLQTPADPKAFKAAKEKDSLVPGSALPPLSSKGEVLVQDATASLKGRAGSDIAKLGPALLKRAEASGDSRALMEIDAAITAAQEAGSKREERAKALIKTGALMGRVKNRKDVLEILDRNQLAKMKEDTAYVDELMKAVDAVQVIRKPK